MRLSDEQQRVVAAFDDLVSRRRRRMSVGGYAGTGKTVVVQAILAEYGKVADIGVCAPTGKAAHVLRSKGVENACTFHSLVYRVAGVNESGDPIFATRRRRDLPACVIVDEASMLTVDMVKDIERRVPHVLYVGDHGQLEPVGDDPGLMRRPDFKLETIHRQAAGSPIIQFAHHVRRGHDPETFGDLARVQRAWTSDLAGFDVAIVAFNRTRQKINQWTRKRRGFDQSTPMVGEQVICLRNNADYEVWNGMLGTITEVTPGLISVATDDGERKLLPYEPRQFGLERTLPYAAPRKGKPTKTLWDWAYAVTCHKFQGSEAGRVVVVEEGSGLWAPERWRYTAATRAKQELRWYVMSR